MLRQSAADLRCVSAAANDRGYLAERLGDFDQALSRLEQAASGFHRSGEPKLEGQALSNLGLLMSRVGDYQRAIGYYDTAKALLRTRDAVANARVLNNLGLSYQSLAEYEQAAICFERALRDFNLHRSPGNAVRARLNLGRNSMLAGNPAAARKILEAALLEAQALSDGSAQADTLDNLGQALLTDGAPAEARKSLVQALTLHRSVGDKRMEAIDLHYLGIAANAGGEASAARDYLNQALEIRLACGLRDAATDSLFALAGLEQGAGQAGTARELAGRGLAIMESVRSRVPGPELRASFYARQRRFIDLLVDLEMTAENPNAVEDGLLAVERGRGRALIDLLVEDRLLEQVPEELRRRRTHVQQEIDLLAVQLSASKPERTAELRTRVEALVSEDEQIGARIRQSLAEEKLGRPLESLSELQAYLQPDNAILEYHLGEKQGYLWLVERSAIRLFRLPARAVVEAQCAPVLRLFPDILERQRSPAAAQRFERALRQLSAILMGPLANIPLPTRVIIVPDGPLTRVPFAALELPGNRRLGLVHDVVQVSSASFLAAGRQPRPVTEFPKAFLSVSDPVYSPGDSRVAAGRDATPSVDAPSLARLPYNAELDAVMALLPDSRRRFLRGFEASAAAVERLPLGDYAILHFSAHALIDDRVPELSRIALSMVDPRGHVVDGFLRPYQLSQLRLNGSTVVLSACETALGRQVLGEGLAGFSTSLFSAGAAQLVLTLSPVDAEASSEFLSQTYRRVFGPRPVAMEHAITLARRAFAGSRRWSDPYYWASFVIYGRPSEQDGQYPQGLK